MRGKVVFTRIPEADSWINLPIFQKYKSDPGIILCSWLLHPFPKFESLQWLSSAFRIETNTLSVVLWSLLFGSWIPLWPHLPLSEYLLHFLFSATLASILSYLPHHPSIQQFIICTFHYLKKYLWPVLHLM